MSNPAIKIQNLSKVYKLYDHHRDRLKESLHPLGKKYHRLFYALKNINLEVQKGEILGIIGLNGAGKSTLINIISGILSPSSGQFTTCGRISAVLGLGTGFDPELTGIENVYFNGMILGFSEEEMKGRLDDILSFADIGKFASQPLKTFSAGMKARLGFAVASNIDPDILILDEVMAVGDELFRRKCFAKMEEYFNKGITVLFVSHNLNSVNDICSRAILLDKGDLILKGPTKLVSMEYSKYLYSKPKTFHKAREGIIKLNRDERKKREFIENLKVLEKAVPGKLEGTKDHIDKNEIKQKAQHLPAFKSRTQIIQKNEDLEIYDLNITTLSSEKVNFLVTNEDYFFCFKVKFNTDIENIQFPWVIKESRGRKLSGSGYPKDENTFISAKRGQTYVLKWKFKCALYRGIYYIDVGVIRYHENEKKVAILVQDALVFKVQKSLSESDDIEHWGLFDMKQRLENVKILE